MSKKRQREFEQQLLHGMAGDPDELLSDFNIPSVQLDRSTNQWDASSYIQTQKNQKAILSSYRLTGNTPANLSAPSKMASRKHHITSLVGAAAAVELDLASKKASANFKHETKKKYGM